SNTSISRKREGVEKKEGLMRIEGWVIGMVHDETISVEDENGKQIPHEMMRMIRTDVNTASAVGKEAENDQCGFQIRLRRKDLRCRRIHQKISNRLTSKEFVLDL